MKNILPLNIQKSIDHIQQDNTSGSIELAIKSAKLLIQLTQSINSRTHIKTAAIMLTQAQPTMASIFNLVNNLLLTMDTNKKQPPKKIVQNYCTKFLSDLKTSETSINKQTTSLIQNNTTILTHSYSSTVLNTLLFAQQIGKQFTVICTESRPKNEGIYLAQQLASNGIHIKLIVDSAAFSFIPNADMILVGGDAITSTGLINKIGTRGLAISAQHYDTPIYTLCSTIKFLPPTYQIHLNHQKNPKEIIPHTIPNVTPINYYFDRTPLEFFTGIITENDILKPPAIKVILQQQQIHKSLS